MVNDLFVARDVAVCFVMAVQTQVNEITNDKHLQANQQEFLEMFARAADKASFAPLNLNPEVTQTF